MACLAVSNATAASIPLPDKHFSARYMGFAADNARACLLGSRFDPDTGQGSGELVLLDLKRDAVRWHVRISPPEDFVSLQPEQCAIDGENVYLLANVNTQSQQSMNQTLVYLYQFSADGKQLGFKNLIEQGRDQYGYALGLSANGVQVAGYIKDVEKDVDQYSLFTVAVDRQLKAGKPNVRKTGAFASGAKARLVGDNLYIAGQFLPAKLAQNDWVDDFANSRLLVNGGYAWSMRPFKKAPRDVAMGVSQQGALYSLAYGDAGSTLAVTSAEGKQLSLASYPSKYCESSSISEYGNAVLALRKPCSGKSKAAELLAISPASGKETPLQLAPGEPVFAATNMGQWFVVSKDSGKLALSKGSIEGDTVFSLALAGVEHSLNVGPIKVNQKGEHSFDYVYEQRAGDCRFSLNGRATELDVFNPEGPDGKEAPQIVVYDSAAGGFIIPLKGPLRTVTFEGSLSPEQLKNSCGSKKAAKFSLEFNAAGARR